MKRGRLIVFEGIDGVGKTTFSKMIGAWLRTNGQNAHNMSFPGREPGTLSEHVYELHHSPTSFGIEALHPASRQVLHIAAHVEVIEARIRPALASGAWVILDRFWWSTVAYGLASGVDAEFLELLVQAESKFWGDILPAVIFYIERPANDEPIDQGLLCAYDALIRDCTGSSVVRVKNDAPIPEVLTRIWSSIQNLELKIGPAAATQFPSSEPPPRGSGPTVFSKLSPAKATVVYDTYWRFAAERQAIFFRRFRGEPGPWTDDPILQAHKFTNAYRASDRVSQYLVKHVIYAGDQSPSELGFRILLFKLFNKIETWMTLCASLGELRADMFNFKHYDAVLTRASAEGRAIYSGAYIMPSGGSGNPGSKHTMHLRLLERLISDRAFDRIAELKRMRDGFDLLRAYPSFGDFLAYQYITDINYSPMTNFSEMEFVIPGPGARDGVRKCFSTLGGLSESDMIRVVTERQEEEFARLGLDFQSLWGRPLQLIDCQNLFCEVDKYSRVKHPEIAGLSGRTRIKQKFKPKPLGRLPYWYPPKWGINASIERVAHVFDF